MSTVVCLCVCCVCVCVFACACLCVSVFLCLWLCAPASLRVSRQPQTRNNLCLRDVPLNFCLMVEHPPFSEKYRNGRPSMTALSLRPESQVPSVRDIGPNTKVPNIPSPAVLPVKSQLLHPLLASLGASPLRLQCSAKLKPDQEGGS